MAQGSASGGPSLEGMARQFFEGWQRMLQPGAGAGAFGGGAAPTAMFEEMMDRFGRGASGFMDMASQFGAGKAPLSGTPAELTAFWRELLSRAGNNPMLDALGSLEGAHARSLLDLGEAVDRWSAPMLEQFRGLLDRPAFGLLREHQEAQQRLARDLMDHRREAEAFRRLLQEIGEDALRRFEGKLEAHSEPGRQLESIKALFDLWIDAAEEAWGEAALSDRFVAAYGRLGIAAMRVRQGVQRQVATLASEFGLVSRHEIDGGHRRLAELEREVRELRRRLGPASASGGGSSAGAGGANQSVRGARAAKAAPKSKASKAPKASESTRATAASRPDRASKAPGASKASVATRATKAGKATKISKATKARKATKATKATQASKSSGSRKATRNDSRSTKARAALQAPVPRRPASRGGR